MLQRKCKPVSKIRTPWGGVSLQRAAIRQDTPADQGASATPLVHDVLNSPGKPLDETARAVMEPAFGHDFSGVRLHIDARAGESALAVNANAYTVGRHIVFGAQQYQPHDASNRRLLAHELAHVVQQERATSVSSQLTIGPAGDSLEQEADLAASRATEESFAVPTMSASGSVQRLQRDLATPPPAVDAAAQPDLTADQVQEAIRFNRTRYNEANTRLIQNLLGGPVTGVWTEENIEAIANTQQQYGLKKDGKVGDETFRFLNREQRLEDMSRSNQNCLVSFRLVGPTGQNFGRDDPTHCHFNNFFRIEAQFSPRCDCNEFEYRQFIRGHWRRTRGGVVTDLPIRLPGGVLPAAFIEDEDTAAAVPHYGHRDDRAEVPPAEVEDHYINARGADDQANGCRFRSTDAPGFNQFPDCLPGDQYDLLTSFRGEIQRNGAVIAGQQKFWTAINLANWRP